MFNKSLDLSIPKKIDILILDDQISRFDFRNFSQKVLKKNEINFYCLIKTLFTFYFEKELNFKQLYKFYLYKMYSPVIAISHDMNKKGEECKKLCPEIVVIIYQFSYFHNYNKKKNKISSKNFDYYLIWNKNDKKFFKNIPKKKIIVTGSIRNNFILLNKNRKIYRLTLISEFSNSIDKKNIFTINFKKCLKIIDAFCSENNIKLLIALRSRRQDKNLKLEDEKKFYKKFLKCKYSFDDISSNSYETAALSNLIICYHSTLGFESLSRKFKVFFLPFHENILQKTNNLAKSNNFHIHRTINKKEISKKILILLKMTNNTWKKKIGKVGYLCDFDTKNRKLNKLVKNIISKKDDK